MKEEHFVVADDDDSVVFLFLSVSLLAELTSINSVETQKKRENRSGSGGCGGGFFIFPLRAHKNRQLWGEGEEREKNILHSLSLRLLYKKRSMVVVVVVAYTHSLSDSYKHDSLGSSAWFLPSIVCEGTRSYIWLNHRRKEESSAVQASKILWFSLLSLLGDRITHISRHRRRRRPFALHQAEEAIAPAAAAVAALHFLFDHFFFFFFFLHSHKLRLQHCFSEQQQLAS